MRILAIGAVIAGMCALPASAQISGLTGEHVVLSDGQDSCDQFLAKDPVAQQVDVVWILGYITGANSRGQTENDRNVGSSFRDPEAVQAWVQQYCREHGFDVMAKVAEALRNEFAKREGRQSGTNLRGAGSSANLSGTNLTGAILSGADLTNADLSSINLSIADLRDANLSGANLTGADLSDAGLSGTNLSGANLSDTKGLTQEQLDYACGRGVKGLDKLNPPLTFADRPCRR